MKPDFELGNIKLYNKDCGDVLPHLSGISSCVTDPPYGLNFMGSIWDKGVPNKEIWHKISKALLPGAFLLAFGGTRTFHRMAVNIEDCGEYQLRDMMMWLYSVGFPKSLDISKKFDKDNGTPPTKVCRNPNSRENVKSDMYKSGRVGKTAYITEPTSDEAKKWEGWGTNLKPCWEPIIVAMKNIDGDFINNARKHDVAGINIDGSRLGGKDGRWPNNVMLSHHPECEKIGETVMKGRTINRWKDGSKPFGDGAGHEFEGEKFPDETIDLYKCHPDCPRGIIDKQSGDSKSPTKCVPANRSKSQRTFGDNRGLPNTSMVFGYGDSGGASRFFYCPKISVSERTCEGSVKNEHLTVKPIDLMRYLVCLSKTPVGGIVLDPFMGSGSTGLACILENRPFIGIEKDKDSFETACNRIQYWYDRKGATLEDMLV